MIFCVAYGNRTRHANLPRSYETGMFDFDRRGALRDVNNGTSDKTNAWIKLCSVLCCRGN